jgi:signal transduction histidine kinase
VITLVDRQDEVRELDALRLEVAKLRASRRRLAISGHTERRGIERELHGGVLQLLVALAANVELATASVEGDPASAEELLAEIAEDARELLEETRRLAERIYPPQLEAGGLVAALRAEAVSADVKTKIDVAAGTYPPEIAAAVFFCCLDVIEQAGAGANVAMAVRNDDGTVAFEIDAEVDLDDERLRDRVEALGGRLTITKGSAGKVSVAGSLPLSG